MVVIPVINCDSFEDAKIKIEKAAKFTDWVHIDVVDGRFAPNLTWGDPVELREIKDSLPNLKVEAHLMVVNPEKVIPLWTRAGLVRRIIVHVEALSDAAAIAEDCKSHGVELMFAAAPDTPAERLLEFRNFSSLFQILAVRPGRAGQKFQHGALAKIKFLKTQGFDATIEVDGGIDLRIAKLLKAAGVNIIASASYIYEDADPEEAYRRLSLA